MYPSKFLRLCEINLEYIHWKDWCWSWSSNTLATWYKSWLFGKVPDAGEDWGHEEKGATEDEVVGWHCRLDGHDLGHTLRDSEEQGSLVCYSPWGCKETQLSDWIISLYLRLPFSHIKVCISPKFLAITYFCLWILVKVCLKISRIRTMLNPYIFFIKFEERLLPKWPGKIFITSTVEGTWLASVVNSHLPCNILIDQWALEWKKYFFMISFDASALEIKSVGHILW